MSQFGDCLMLYGPKERTPNEICVQEQVLRNSSALQRIPFIFITSSSILFLFLSLR